MPKNELQKTEYGLRKENKVRITEIQKNILDSGILEMYIQMGLTGREYFLVQNEETGVWEPRVGSDDSAMLSQAERMKIMTTLVNKVLPVMKDSEEEQQTNSSLAEIAKTLKNQ